MTALRHIETDSRERRKHSRIPVAVNARLMLETRQELDCQITDMSLGGMHLRTRAYARCGTSVVAYVDHFGRLQGRIVRATEDGFAVALDLPTVKRDRVASLLTWLVDRGSLGTPEDRCHERIVPVHTETSLELTGGRQVPARIVDFSRSGAAVSAGTQPKVGVRVTVGRTAGKVIRHFDGGIGVEFLRLVPSDRFDDQYVL